MRPLRERTTRLGYALELILVIAVAMALARTSVVMNREFSDPPARGWWDAWWRFCFVFEPFMSGVALAGGAGLAIEGLRRHSPSVWGWGRWTWSVACLVVLMNFAGKLVVLVIWLMRHSGRPFAPQGLLINLMGFWPEQFSNTILLALVPTLITARLARVPVDPSPDGREWAGRSFALLSVIWAGIFRILPLFSG